MGPGHGGGATGDGARIISGGAIHGGGYNAGAVHGGGYSGGAVHGGGYSGGAVHGGGLFAIIFEYFLDFCQNFENYFEKKKTLFISL